VNGGTPLWGGAAHRSPEGHDGKTRLPRRLRVQHTVQHFNCTALLVGWLRAAHDMQRQLWDGISKLGDVLCSVFCPPHHCHCSSEAESSAGKVPLLPSSAAENAKRSSSPSNIRPPSRRTVA